jgi:hypothetical protein
MRTWLLLLLIVLLAASVGCTSSGEGEPAGESAPAGDGVVRLVFFWSDT